ncbi:MAG: hypothetical protein F6K62_10270 [Sphaerospermopsis sp. SIO1G2]|nr:hypothetical protein [Sphaerospermopsis sp. SIO1G2]
MSGQYLSDDTACISTKDRGFRFGDGIFETIAVVESIPYLWELHANRLKHGLRAIYMDADIDALLPPLLTVIKKNAVSSGVARILITRGVGSRGYLPTVKAPTILIEAESAPLPLITPSLRNPIHLWQSPWRRFPAECLPTDAKIMQGMNATLARVDAQQHAADEALLLSYAGDICELSSGSLFWLHGETLYTPSLDTGALAGTMRERLLALWDGCAIEQVSAPPDILHHCDAVIMTNALCGAVPIASLMNHNLYFPHSTALAVRCNALIDTDIMHNLAGFTQKYLASTPTHP